MNQDWNDAKSQLQQCCLTLRDPTDGDPDIPQYKFVSQLLYYNNNNNFIIIFYYNKNPIGNLILCCRNYDCNQNVAYFLTLFLLSMILSL